MTSMDGTQKPTLRLFKAHISMRFRSKDKERVIRVIVIQCIEKGRLRMLLPANWGEGCKISQIEKYQSNGSVRGESERLSIPFIVC
jgi:hypothetical protein